jgi:uncharacterized integral membrane protein
MINGFFLALIIGTTVAFSVQNADDVAVSFLVWRFDISLSTVTVAAVLAGIIVAQLLRRLITKSQEKAKNKVEFVTRRHH